MNPDASRAGTDDNDVINRAAELVHSNEILRKELVELRQNGDELRRRLQAAIVSREADRDGRRAALNLMEDAVLARQTELAEMTERRRVEEELRQANQRKDEFLATLAHELRNPLAPIRNSLHILRLSASQTGGNERILDMLERQVSHLVRLVDDLMEVSRITRDKIDLRKEQVELAAIVRSAVEASSSSIEAARHQLAISLPAEPVILEADPVRLGQVLTNLLNNAAKYTDPGGQIWLSAQTQGSTAIISVKDNGIGIEPENLQAIFTLFTQIDRSPTQMRQGLGIGLTLVRKLVEAHGGSVEARSEGPGRGSEFIVDLPLVAGKQVIRQQARRTDSPHSLSSFHILVVDDNHDAADSLTTVLRVLGAQVRTAYDGLAALEAVNEFRPGVAFIDIGMAKMDGHELARRLRQRPDTREATLIAMTGWGQQEDRRKSKEAGFDCHLVKPVEIGTLETLLRAGLKTCR